MKITPESSTNYLEKLHKKLKDKILLIGDDEVKYKNGKNMVLGFSNMLIPDCF